MGQIVCTDKGILAVEQNKVLIPPTWNKTFAWGYADLSCRLGTYESDKVCTVACSLMSSCSSVAWRSCLMGVGIAQSKGFSAALPQARGREIFTASRQDRGASGQVTFPAEKTLLEGCVPGASSLPSTPRTPPGGPSQPGVQYFCQPEEPPFASLSHLPYRYSSMAGRKPAALPLRSSCGYHFESHWHLLERQYISDPLESYLPLDSPLLNAWGTQSVSVTQFCSVTLSWTAALMVSFYLLPATVDASFHQITPCISHSITQPKRHFQSHNLNIFFPDWRNWRPPIWTKCCFLWFSTPTIVRRL